MLSKAQVAVAGFVILLLSALVSYAVSAAAPTTLLPAGSSRFAVATNDVQATRGGDTSSWLPTGLSQSIQIPAGKKGDVMMWFCSEANPGGGWIQVRARIGGSYFSPDPLGGGVDLRSYVTNVESSCINFVRTRVGAGTRNIAIEWLASDSDAALYLRSMIVVVNIR